MTRLLFAVLFLVLVSGPAFGHGLGHQGHGGAAGPAVAHQSDAGEEEPVRHRHDPSVSFHCAVSASCAPLFLMSWGNELPRMVPMYAGWGIAADTLHRGSVPERDPPVPRV